uniref:substrate-binding periplasmic protein n=1 Tax=uncultured Draconibacterium sp. TaxID=1573823 RepID=UPI0032162A5A
MAIKSKFLSKVFFIMFVVFMNFSCDKVSTDNNPQLTFLSEEYKPFNYSLNSLPTGLSCELLEKICNKLNIEFEVEFREWDNAYNSALTTDNAILFSTVLNSNRRDLFNWVGPVASLDWNFYCASGNNFKLRDIDDAKEINKIGIIADYAMDDFLKEKGFTNLVYCNNISDAVTRLINGEIDLFPSNTYSINAALESIDQSEYAVTNLLTIKTELLYFAFNKNISLDIVEKFQKEVDNSKTNGVLQQLTQKHLQSSNHPGIIQLYTESYEPLTYLNNNGEITGFGTDVVNEIMSRNKVYDPVILSSWSNGYQLALNNPNFCLFTMDRTEIREDLFQWVGPIGTNATYIYTKAGSTVSIKTLDDAKALSTLGVIDSWFSTQYLQEQDFTNLFFESDPAKMTKLLMNGDVDAFVCTNITFPSILKAQGYNYDDVNPAYELMASDFYIAFSNNTSPVIVNKWQATLDEMVTDNTYATIKNKWFPK